MEDAICNRCWRADFSVADECGSSQIVQREVRNAVLDAGESGVQGVYSDV